MGAPSLASPRGVTTTWDVSSDRNKLLVELSSRTGGTTLAFVSNWFDELRRRAPAKK
jgi:hypothetical protein